TRLSLSAMSIRSCSVGQATLPAAVDGVVTLCALSAGGATRKLTYRIAKIEGEHLRVRKARAANEAVRELSHPPMRVAGPISRTLPRPAALDRNGSRPRRKRHHRLCIAEPAQASQCRARCH